MLTPEFLPVVGGVGNYVVEMAKHMPRDVEMTIVTPEPANSLESVKGHIEQDFSDNIAVRFLGKSGDAFFQNFAFQLKCRKALPMLVRDLKVDLIHTHSEMPDYFVPPSRTGVPVLTTVHTTVQGHYEALKSLKGPWSELSLSEKFVLMGGPILKRMEDRYYSDERSYLTVSEWGKRQLAAEKGVNPDTIQVVYNGVDSTLFNPNKRADSMSVFSDLLEDESVRILYLSRVAARKGIGVLAKAIPKILDKVDAHFFIAGPGTPSGLNLPKDHCTVLGYVSGEKIPYLYAFADVYTLPSLYENFPICILEAMASQTAVLATDVCGIPEMIQNGVNGIMVPPNNSDALTTGLTMLSEDENMRNKLARRARVDAVEKFSWETSACSVLGRYRKLLGGC